MKLKHGLHLAYCTNVHRGETWGEIFHSNINALLFSDDGRDDYLCAEHYVMLGNWDRDPDRSP